MSELILIVCKTSGSTDCVTAIKINYLRIFIVLLAFLMLTQGCNKNEKIVEYVYEQPQNGKVYIDETKVEIGQKIIAHFINTDSIEVYSVTLNEKNVTFKQIDDTTVTLIVPHTYMAYNVGNFIFRCRMTTASFADTVLVSNQIKYKYEDFPYPYVKWNTTEKVTEYDSWKYDGYSQNEWKIQRNYDTVKFIRSYPCHDECGITETLVFMDNGNNTLPKFLYASFDRIEWMKDPIHLKADQVTKIMLDNWGSNSFYSGTFSCPDYSWVFWTKK